MNIKSVKKCPLFLGLTENQISGVIAHISPVKRLFSRDEYLFTYDDVLCGIGIVLSGNIQIVKEEVTGNSIILADLYPGEMFGESFALSGEALTVSVKAMQEQTEVIFLPAKEIMPGSDCPFIDVISSNLIRSFARKNLFLKGRIEHLTRHTLSEKVMAYLTDCARKSGSSCFTVPFDRQAMADYLAADRSALSFVLSKLKKEGLIDYRKNSFTLLRFK